MMGFRGSPGWSLKECKSCHPRCVCCRFPSQCNAKWQIRIVSLLPGSAPEMPSRTSGVPEPLTRTNGPPGWTWRAMKNPNHGSRALVFFAGKPEHHCSLFLEFLLTHSSNGCGLDIAVKNGRVVGVRGRATDRVNKGRLGPKGLTGYAHSFAKFRGNDLAHTAQLESHQQQG
jgi:hypothetical protein